MEGWGQNIHSIIEEFTEGRSLLQTALLLLVSCLLGLLELLAEMLRGLNESALGAVKLDLQVSTGYW